MRDPAVLSTTKSTGEPGDQVLANHTCHGTAGLPPTRELQRPGVRRLSAATWLARAALRAARDAAAAFLASGDSDALASATGASIDYNALFPHFEPVMQFDDKGPRLERPPWWDFVVSAN
jgi:2-methylisocitrate lyase-like PEP mutase family enzyme